MRCEAALSKDYLRIDHNSDSDGQCRRVAAFEIDGKHMCPEHTAMRLLEKAKANGTIKRITRRKGEKEYRSAGHHY